jgi:hypothetical protein
MEKNATTEANEITVGEIRPLTNAELRIMEGTAFFLRSYAINGNFAGYLFHGANGPISPIQSLELVKGGEPQEATALNASKPNKQPSVYGGDLSRKELIKWLHQVTSVLEGEETARQRLAALEEDVALCQSWIKKNDDFISENIHPKTLGPIQPQDTQGNYPCKSEVYNQQN